MRVASFIAVTDGSSFFSIIIALFIKLADAESFRDFFRVKYFFLRIIDFFVWVIGQVHPGSRGFVLYFSIGG
jgi:hypothetical protein